MLDNLVELYRNNGEDVGTWKAWTEGAEVHIAYAKAIGGKETHRVYTAEGKNIGRSNETTPETQAAAEVVSRAKKQRDKGYVSTISGARSKMSNGLGFEKPMLATPIEKVKESSIDWDNAYIQPKLDGHRAMFKNGVLYSRGGKEITTMGHIVKELKELGLDQYHLDGELYLHGKSLQEISSLVKREQEDSIQVEYWIYDRVDRQEWFDRFHDVLDDFSNIPTYGGNVVLVEDFRISTREEADRFHTRNLDNGFEGSILRHGKEGYQDNKRSRNLLKLKDFQDAEFRIVEVAEGKAVRPGGGPVPVWVCEVTPGGDVFNCTAQGTAEEKERLWEERQQHIGKTLTVKFFHYSKDGVPLLPVALRFREEL